VISPARARWIVGNTRAERTSSPPLRRAAPDPVCGGVLVACARPSLDGDPPPASFTRRRELHREARPMRRAGGSVMLKFPRSPGLPGLSEGQMHLGERERPSITARALRAITVMQPRSVGAEAHRGNWCRRAAGRVRENANGAEDRAPSAGEWARARRGVTSAERAWRQPPVSAAWRR
jgi:hypothetical protein